MYLKSRWTTFIWCEEIKMIPDQIGDEGEKTEQQSQAKKPSSKGPGQGNQKVTRIDGKGKAQLRNLDSSWPD